MKKKFNHYLIRQFVDAFNDNKECFYTEEELGIILHYFYFIEPDKFKMRFALKIALKQYKKDVRFIIYAARYYTMIENYEKALKFLMLIDIYPQSDCEEEVYVLRGDCYTKSKLHKMAIYWYKRAAHVSSTKENYARQIGDNYCALNNFDDALKYYMMYFSQYADDESIIYDLNFCWANLGTYKVAIDFLQRYIKTNNPFSAIAWFVIGLDYVAMDNFIEATESFKFSLAINPESAATYFNLGNAYFQISEYAKAIDAYQNSMKYEDNKQYVTLNYIGECYMMMEEYDDAVSFFNRSLEINDNYDEGYCSMAKAFNKQEKNIEALVCIDKAISINGKEPDFFSVKGNVLFDLDRFDETEVCLLKALELNPEDIDLRIGVVGFYLFMNEPDKGINFLIEYVNNSDVEDIVLCLYSICNFYAGNKQEAYKYLSKALAANPDVISWINDNENYSDFTADPGINELLH